MTTMLIDPGGLRTELSLQAVALSADGAGGHTETWTEVARLFAHLEPIEAKSVFGAGQTLETVTHRITMRFRSEVESGMRLVKQQRVFHILTVSDPDETGRYLVCRACEKGR